MNLVTSQGVCQLLPEPEEEVLFLVSLQASILVSTELSRVLLKPEAWLLSLVWGLVLVEIFHFLEAHLVALVGEGAGSSIHYRED